MKNYQRINNDFKDYEKFLVEYFPKHKLDRLELFSFYKHVNDIFVLCDILLEYEKLSPDDNYHNLLIEYREFNTRLLTTIALNDNFLIENIMRIIVEKVYRIICGNLNPKRGEKRIRKDSRSDLKRDLQTNISIDNFDDLDFLYGIYSTRVHHTESMPSDYYDLTRRLENEQPNLNELIENIEKIKKIFLEEIFVKLSPNSISEELSYKMRIRNNTSDEVIIFLKLGL